MRRTLRMRLALLYGGVFFVSGTILLAFVYAAVLDRQVDRASRCRCRTARSVPGRRRRSPTSSTAPISTSC